MLHSYVVGLKGRIPCVGIRRSVEAFTISKRVLSAGRGASGLGIDVEAGGEPAIALQRFEGRGVVLACL